MDLIGAVASEAFESLGTAMKVAAIFRRSERNRESYKVAEGISSIRLVLLVQPSFGNRRGLIDDAFVAATGGAAAGPEGRLARLSVRYGAASAG
jgi:hypothetical protein